MHRRTTLTHELIVLLAAGVFIAFAALIPTFFFDAETSWTLWWIENGFHMLGGAYAFFLAREMFLFARLHHRTTTARWMELAIFVLGALAIGVAWEWFELAIDRYGAIVHGLPSIMAYADNIGDLVFDVSGALIAAFFHHRYYGTGKRR